MEICNRLLSLVARAYFEPLHIIVLDLLASQKHMTLEQLQKALGNMNKVVVQQACGDLAKHGMLKTETRWVDIPRDPSKGPPPPPPPTSSSSTAKVSNRYRRSQMIYYIDYRYFINAVKYKIYYIGKSIQKEVEAQLNQLPFKCVKCTKEFSALDMLSLERTADSMPLCDLCGNEVQLDETTRDKDSSASYTRFMNESMPIVELLKQTDKANPLVADTDNKLATAAQAGGAEQRSGISVKEASASAGPQIIVELDGLASADADIKGEAGTDGGDGVQADEMVAVGSTSTFNGTSAMGGEGNINDDDDDDDEEFEAVPVAIIPQYVSDEDDEDDEDEDEEFTDV
ncbi:hypothetical protein BC831DRAFT_401466 [Entophlyctis helioformis]|nr:hypothetical protein BC831DRAFT_401466 [Entophlyctis helioformis]